MSQPVIQTAFHAGELAPALRARVDLAKYHSGAALLENFFVDYRGGVSTRPGTKYILQAYRSGSAVRLITFQASYSVGYVLEFGHNYIRFYNNGSPILESTLNITGATRANPCVISVTNSYSVGQWVYITGVAGMTQLNNRYYIISSCTAGTITLTDLFGNAVDSSAYGVWTSGGTVARVYTLPTSYAASDLSTLKFAQDGNKLVICHANYAPAVLTLISAADWTLVAIAFGSTAGIPTTVAVSTTLAAGNANYAYAVTAIDSSGQESGSSALARLASKQDLRTTAGTNTVSWSSVSGAMSYNVYKTQLSYAGAVPSGSALGFIGSCTSTSFIDSNISPDYATTPPIPQNPFYGAGVASVTVTASGSYTTVPSVTFGASPSGITATGSVALKVVGTPTPSYPGGVTLSYAVGDTIVVANGVIVKVAAVTGGMVTAFYPITEPGCAPGSVTSGSVPSNPMTQISTSGTGRGCQVNCTWGVGTVSLSSPGTGYVSAPTVTFSSGAATATAVLGSASSGNPTVPGFYAQRLFLGGPSGYPAQFNLSKTGTSYNFDVSNPVQADDAITGALRSGQLNTIKAAVPMPAGLIVLCDSQSWLINGGSGNTAISPIDIQANSQAYNGCADVPPLVANFDILYVQAKGSIVRNMTYNFYTNVFAGTDISVLSSHLFYGYKIISWAQCEEPFKTIWAVRSDGVLLSLTFVKEQEILGWAHSVTDGLFKSVTSVVETVNGVATDALYAVVERTINGQTVQYVERMAERLFTNGAQDAWCVDSGLQYSGTPATSFSGGEHLAGETVTGLADGEVIPPFVMPSNGSFTLATAASKVTIGMAYTCRLQTLPLNLGEPTVQGKRKKITAVTIRVAEALGLKIGKAWDTLVDMADLIVGNLGSVTNETVTDLVTGDVRTIIDPSWDEQGQYCIEQSSPLPATILGVIPEIVVGDPSK